MAYNKDSFLAGVAAGRAMKSFPYLDASLVFSWHIDLSYLDTTEYYVTLDENYMPEDSGMLDWGDGTTKIFSRAEITHSRRVYHTYGSPGIYRIVLCGVYSCCLHFGNNNAFSECLISVDSPITFPDESNFEARHSYALDLVECRHLKSITNGILRDVSKRGFLFAGADFYRCYDLEEIPNDLLDYIDSDLLAPLLDVPSLCRFEHCRSITAIPKNLFRRNELWSQVLNAQHMFAYCDSLRSVPEGLFSALNHCVKFEGCFRDCISLEIVEDGVFAGCAEATDFSSAFANCAELRIVGDGIFSGCYSATNFRDCFNTCGNLLSIPGDLFADCHSVLYMARCFNSSGIVEIPLGLFDSLTNVTNYSECFRGCVHLVNVPSTLFDSNGESVVDFAYCFYWDSAITSAVPELWIKYPNTPSDKRTACYRYCTNAANYSDIPNQYSPFPPGAWR